MDAANIPDAPARHLFKQEGYALVGAAFEVHRVVGGGLLEEVYQECLEKELLLHCIPYVSHQVLPIFYKGQLLRKTYVPDMFVHGGIVVELKAVQSILPEHRAQLLNYMRLARKPVGYLLNFAPLEELDWERMVL